MVPVAGSGTRTSYRHEQFLARNLSKNGPPKVSILSPAGGLENETLTVVCEKKNKSSIPCVSVCVNDGGNEISNIAILRIIFSIFKDFFLKR